MNAASVGCSWQPLWVAHAFMQGKTDRLINVAQSSQCKAFKITTIRINFIAQSSSMTNTICLMTAS